ncbi:hypothetical protein [Sphingomonas sp. MM-1]|uniref:hypothetical protein n=1 Tax=Sphingomonas sp. MM-1 TaxID=745310 RepID=UPI001650E1AC|nr:hypothetical protein [Sphingomonas sp. MM-1]
MQLGLHLLRLIGNAQELLAERGKPADRHESRSGGRQASECLIDPAKAPVHRRGVAADIAIQPVQRPPGKLDIGIDLQQQLPDVRACRH